MPSWGGQCRFPSSPQKPETTNTRLIGTTVWRRLFNTPPQGNSMKDNPEAIHPLDYRYGDSEVREALSQSEKFRLMLVVEGTVAQTQSELGVIPDWAGRGIAEAAGKGIPVERIREKEKETGHETAAVVACLEEAAGEAGRFVHFGLTSNDVLDTAMFIQISEAGDRVLELVRTLGRGLEKRAEENRQTLCVARTHGMHAEPYTYGLRFAVWLTEITRCYRGLSDSLARAKVGKISGAVGTYAAMGELGPEVERRSLEALGLKPVALATQVVPRDILASVVLQLANLSSVLDNVATTLRNLHRTEIAEVREGRTPGQIGSSAMPHKRNPVGCEKVSGLSRVVRSLALPMLENNVLWDERDLTNSSAERAIIPEAFGLVSEQLNTLAQVIDNLELDAEAIRTNLDLTQGAICSEFILNELIRSGMGRSEAHRLLDGAFDEAKRSSSDFFTVLSKKKAVTSRISGSKLKSLLDPRGVLPMLDSLVSRAVTAAQTAFGTKP